MVLCWSIDEKLCLKRLPALQLGAVAANWSQFWAHQVIKRNVRGEAKIQTKIPLQFWQVLFFNTLLGEYLLFEHQGYNWGIIFLIFLLFLAKSFIEPDKDDL